MNKVRKSDERFLVREVYVTSGQYVGLWALGDLIGKCGLIYFKRHYVSGFTSYEFRYDVGCYERHNEPIEILDSRSFKPVSGIGAMVVYMRFNRVEITFPSWHRNGSLPSRRKSYRKVKTYRTIREASLHFEEEGEVPFSFKTKNAPSSRDCRGRACNDVRSWKRFRSNQYR